jgi:hypothetical protein
LTAIIVIRQSASVHVLADGAVYGPPGFSSHPTTKLWPLPHLSAVVAIRGPQLLAPVIAAILGSAGRTFDELVQTGPGAVKAQMGEFRRLLQQHPDPDMFDIVIAGISDTTGPSGHLIYSHGTYAEAWAAHDFSSSGVAMIPLAEEMRPELREALSWRHHYDLDPVEDGIRLMDIQRRHWPGTPDTTPGGFLQLVTVSADAITTCVIHRWADHTPPSHGGQV